MTLSRMIYNRMTQRRRAVIKMTIIWMTMLNSFLQNEHTLSGTNILKISLAKWQKVQWHSSEWHNKPMMFERVTFTAWQPIQCPKQNNNKLYNFHQALGRVTVNRMILRRMTLNQNVLSRMTLIKMILSRMALIRKYRRMIYIRMILRRMTLIKMTIGQMLSDHHSNYTGYLVVIVQHNNLHWLTSLWVYFYLMSFCSMLLLNAVLLLVILTNVMAPDILLGILLFQFLFILQNQPWGQS